MSRLTSSVAVGVNVIIAYPPVPFYYTSSEAGDQGAIGRGEVIARKLLRPHPPNRLGSYRLWTPARHVTTKNPKGDQTIRILMLNPTERLEVAHRYPQLFSKLSAKACLPRFPRLFLASGKLPVAAEMIIRAAPADEIATRSRDHGHGDPHLRLT
jgi:hypothetical protein